MIKKQSKKNSRFAPKDRPWDRWFGQGSFTLVRHRHFDCQVLSMAIQIRGAAVRRGVRASLHIDDNTIKVRVLPKPTKGAKR